MVTIKKQIVLDEEKHPVAVIIDYQDWQKIEALLQQTEIDVNDSPTSDTAKALMALAGSISLSVNPLDYQRQVRDEWL